jgi:hypothetical protein
MHDILIALAFIGMVISPAVFASTPKGDADES